jgi:tripartite-type tricarboxylate transporter receptor subunit TctC
VFGDERIPALPDLPTSKEKNLSADLSLFNSVISVMIQKDTPADRVKILRDIFKKAAEDPEFKQLADKLGLQAVSYEPEVVERRIVQLKAAGVPLLKQLGLYKQ